MPLTLPQAVLWDLDGTLIDSEHYWLSAERRLAKAAGGDWTESDGQALIGMSLYESSRIINEKLEIAHGVERTIELLTESVQSDLLRQIPWRPGALELLLELRERGVKTALVTIEDSVSGLASAEASGAVAIGVPNMVPLPAKPDRIIWPTLKSVTVDDLAHILHEKRSDD